MQTVLKTKRKSSDDSINQVIGENLRIFRKSKGYSLSRLAEGIGLTYQQVQKYESGKNRLKADIIVQIAGFLDTDPVEFFAFLIEENHKPLNKQSLFNDDTLDLIHLYNQIDDTKMKKSMVAMIKRFLSS